MQVTQISRHRNWPWLTLQIVAANVAIIIALAAVWYLVFTQQSSVYSERLMSTFNIEPGRLHAMYVEDVERQLWVSVLLGLLAAILASIGLAFLIVRPLRSLAKATERLRHGDYQVRSTIKTGEVGNLANNINVLAETLEHEEQRRAQYMADLSHELRTPITNIQGYTEGLEDGVFQADDKFFKLMTGELRQLNTLTNTIDSMQLDVIEADSHSHSNIKVAKYMRELEAGWKARFKARNLQLNIEIGQTIGNRSIAVSPSVFKQILDNLLSNMLRYASSKAPCRIKVSKARKKDFVTFAFSNQAPEIDEECLPFLFDRFYRISDSRTRNHGDHSSGLGLSIVKQLCVSNHGRVSASLHEQSLTILVDLPLGKNKN